MAYGNVYVFNLYGSAATQVNINGQGSAGSIAAPAKGSASPFYSPPQLVVGRSNLTPDQLNNPLFCNGPNTVKINYDGYSWSGTITIPPPASMPLQNDLWLYLAYGQMFLFNTSGTIIPQPGGGGGLQATKGGGKSLSAPLKKGGAVKGSAGGGVQATVKLSTGGAKASKGGAAKAGASKKGAAKGAAKKSSGKR
jgi:hypothetical protein